MGKLKDFYFYITGKTPKKVITVSERRKVLKSKTKNGLVDMVISYELMLDSMMTEYGINVNEFAKKHMNKINKVQGKYVI